ncbi:MAG: hypothetical protein ACLFP8_06755 [Alphaproteobacteria bacterium]
MKIRKTLLGSAALVALSLGYAAEANAFDAVDWKWNNDVNTTVDVDVDVVDTFDFSGLTQVEKAQINIGDVTATSTVSDITNNPPGTAEGVTTGTFDSRIELVADYDANESGNPVSNITVINDPNLTASNPSGSDDQNENQFNLGFDLSGEVEVDLADVVFEGVNDAVDLPSVVSAATAVGNNQSIESTVALNLHDVQVNLGDAGEARGSDEGAFVEALGSLGSTGNRHTDIVAIAALGSTLGAFQQGSVAANSTVSDILNASIDSNASAIANNLSVDVAANTEGDAFALADLQQFNYADVSAASSVSAIDVNNYANLGVLEGPLVNSVATAVGNNVSVSITSPVAAAAPAVSVD